MCYILSGASFRAVVGNADFAAKDGSWEDWLLRPLRMNALDFQHKQRCDSFYLQQQ
jgi:hypothetical protein